GHSAPPAKLPQLLRELIAIGGGAWIDELDLLEREGGFVGLAADRVEIAEQNRPRDALVRKNAGSAQDARVVAFGKYDTRRILLRAGDEAAYHLPLGTESRFQLGAILLDVDDPPRDPGRDGGPRDRRRDPEQHARIERLGNDVVRSELHLLAAICARDRLGHFLFGERGERARRGHFHLLVYFYVSYVE